MREPDAAFADPRLAVLYDVLDGERGDLDLYVNILREIGVTLVVDIGCGTGELAIRLAASGTEVVGVDPASASLDVARSKAGADRVRWLHGDATALRGVVAGADAALMTGNVAQVFVDDSDWSQTLHAVHDCLRPGGRFVFETRRPEARAWEGWGIPEMQVSLPGGSSVMVSRTVTEVAPPLVTFESSIVVDGERIRSTSTLRFREHAEVEHDLMAVGFEAAEVRDAPDRPGRELVFIARRV